MADITVMGAGIFGLSVAWTCAAQGAQVRVIDPNGPGAGASGGIIGALAPHVPEKWNEKKAFQFESLIMAETFWASIAEASGQSPGYARLGRLQPVADEAALTLARTRAENARALWQGKATWRVISAEGDWAPLSASGYLIEDTLSARLHPRAACAALVGAIRAKGGEVVRTGTPEGRLVWATGVAGLHELSRAHTRSVGSGVKGQGALLAYDGAHLPQLFADMLHIIPHEDGTTAIGSTTENTYDDPTSTDAQLDAVIARARAAVPVLADAPVLERWAGIRPRSRSRGPMLGAHPLRVGEFIANGGFKIGFGMAPKVGQVMADLILDGVDRIPEGFRVEASY
ncbi:MAG: FAD-dependent oxidoreductase [Roseovarius sp.]|nr:FAD-dependent oxidoreductase [Roseovarius sp.]